MPVRAVSRNCIVRSLAAAVAAAVLHASAPAAQSPPAMRVLFIGNSLTATHDLPAIVSALARAAGVSISQSAVTAGNFSLEDHWNDGTARRVIARGGGDAVVLQQGPSALPESQRLLVDYARRFDRAIRAAGGRTALYMVWPARARAFDFADVSASYTAAARETGGLLLRAGDAWREAWAIDPSLPLYGPDAFHPSIEGSYLAALVVCQGLTGRSPVGLPSRLDLGRGSVVSIDDEVARTLQRAAAAVAARQASGENRAVKWRRTFGAASIR